MLFLLLILLFTAVSNASISSYEPFNPVNHFPDIENNLDPLELSNRKALQSNKIVECDLEDIYETVGLNELQDLIEALASRKGIGPFAVLRMLYKRMKNREEMEESLMNSIDGVPDLMNPPIIDVPPPSRMLPPPSRILPPPSRMLPPSSRAPYSLPSNVPMHTGVDEDTKVVIIPVSPPVLPPNRFPPGIKTEARNDGPFHINNMGPPIGKMNSVLPAVYPLLSPFKASYLRPPLGATIRVNSGDPRNPINRDITVTISPSMTLIEALRQAEIKYQNVLGLNHDMDVISFTQSAIDCFVVSRIDDVFKSEDSGWKITVADRDGKVIYESFCLPDANEVLVKPGSSISLSFVPL